MYIEKSFNSTKSKDRHHFVLYETLLDKPSINNIIDWPAIPITAAVTLSTPVIGWPLPLHEFAYLCSPSTTVHVGDLNRYAFINESDNITTTPHWVEVDVVTFAKHGCAGWSDSSPRSRRRRPDADHSYSPVININCTIEWGPNWCPKPDWAGQEFPYGYWSEIPLVKKVDLLFRVSMKVPWTHIDFINCAPSLLLHTNTSGWVEHANAFIQPKKIRHLQWKSDHPEVTNAPNQSLKPKKI